MIQNIDKELQNMKYDSAKQSQSWDWGMSYADGSGDDESYDNFTDEYNYAVGKGKARRAARKQARVDKRNGATDCSKLTSQTPLHGPALCVKGRAVYYPGASLAIKAWKKAENNCVCKKRFDEKHPDDKPDAPVVDGDKVATAPASAPSDSATATAPASEVAVQTTDENGKTTTTDASGNVLPAPSGASTGSKTKLYIGIGAGVLVLAIIGIVLMKRK